METPDPHKLARDLAALEANMEVIRNEFKSIYDRISAQIAAAEAERKADLKAAAAEREADRKATEAARKVAEAERKADAKRFEAEMAKRDRSMLTALLTAIIGGFVMLGFFLRYASPAL